MNFNSETPLPPGANIKVIGVGGGGGNAVNTMIRSALEGVEFVAVNTDVQALRFALPQKKIQIGKELTKGLGAGADPDVGRDAALEDRHEIQEALANSDMVFITAGMGGGTGTGGASVIAQIAREMGALTVAVVTKPFNFEGKRRRKHAEMGIERLRESVDTLITIPNQRLLQIATPELSMIDAFRLADDVLVNAVKGISDIINIPGTVNVDFADVKTVMSSMGMALMGIGTASGEGRAVEAARKAICSPLLEDIDIEGATGILINITAGSSVTLMEVNEACSIIQDAAHEDANIIFGAVIDDTIGDTIRVTVIATGFPSEYDEKVVPSKIKTSPSLIGGLSAKNAGLKDKVTSSTFVNQARRDSFNLDTYTKERPGATAAAFSGQATTPPAVKKSPAAKVSDAPITPRENLTKAFEENISPNSEAEDLTRLTMNGLDNVELPKEETPTAPAEETVAKSEPTPVSTAAESFFADDEEMSDPDLAFDSQTDNDSHTPTFNAEGEAPIEALFTKGPSVDGEKETPKDKEKAHAPTRSENAEFAQKLDEAMEIAERLKGLRSDKNAFDDELDIPAFLRKSSKDISLD